MQKNNMYKIKNKKICFEQYYSKGWCDEWDVRLPMQDAVRSKPLHCNVLRDTIMFSSFWDISPKDSLYPHKIACYSALQTEILTVRMGTRYPSGRTSKKILPTGLLLFFRSLHSFRDIGLLISTKFLALLGYYIPWFPQELSNVVSPMCWFPANVYAIGAWSPLK